MDNLLRYCLCGLLLVSPIALAADRVIVVEPSQLQKTFSPGQAAYAWSDSRSWAEPVTVQNGRLNVPVTRTSSYGWPKAHTALKNIIKASPAQLAGTAAFAAIFAGIDWLMEDGVLVKRTTGEPVPTSQFGYYVIGPKCNGQKFSSNSAAHACFTAAESAAYAAYGLGYQVQQGRSVQVDSTTFNNYIDIRIAGPWQESGSYQIVQLQGICQPPATLSNGVCSSVGGQSAITQAEIDAAVDQFNDKQKVADIANQFPSFEPDFDDLTGPSSITGDPIVSTKNTPSGSEVTTTTPSYSFDYSTNPLSITTTTNNTTTVYNNGTLVSTTNTTNAGTVNPVEPVKPPEIPTDCEFMPTVCAWLDWFKTPAEMPEPDMPQPVDDDFVQQYSVSFGGSCPAPRTVDTQFGTLSLSWQPLCDLASIIKYLVIASASLYAAFIGLGISRGNN